MVVTISLGGLVVDQMRYNLESTPYVLKLLYDMVANFILCQKNGMIKKTPSIQ